VNSEYAYSAKEIGPKVLPATPPECFQVGLVRGVAVV
jgi:hypothetical protein